MLLPFVPYVTVSHIIKLLPRRITYLITLLSCISFSEFSVSSSVIQSCFLDAYYQISYLLVDLCANLCFDGS